MKDVKLSIFRQDPETEKEGRFVEYTIPYVEGMVVLDAVRYVEEKIDTTLAVRWNCKAAHCGSCSAEINDKPSLMCKTRIETLGDRIKVGPMKAYPLIKDLVTDVGSNWKSVRRVPAFKPKEGLKDPWRMQQVDIERSKEFKRCIECFLCQDVCHVMREHYEETDYFGPRHMVRAASLDMHPLDDLSRSRFLNEEAGIGYCNITKCCQETCPEHIPITDDAIIPEKERAVDITYDPIARLIIGRKSKKRGN
ncbi:succinate dehydrogenase/fumarate reductase iron-sulfur subunit [Oxyplasma meridianum]|uniref:Succinate dehydrogenase/fumarate reductase iron-sulfur subunit n=1 Tax=Oxyplasma meridianum TaxID=3073602 RepID=A0AAX4NGB1_9ARCH